ncbi:MAG: hypothetical protein C0602_02545 [Denitrovibrio sp.]|nr:MAG: hypothetical protein C0602_02545 [Denitrovibrio sp.]
MRFILTAAVWAVILALVSFVFSIRGMESGPIDKEVKEKHAEVSFEITATFSVEDDPFALNIGDKKSAFELVLDGQTVFSAEKGINDRVSFTTESFELSTGKHELFVKANPSDTRISQAVRVQVLLSGNPISSETYWFNPGQAVNAAHVFEVTEKGSQNEH